MPKLSEIARLERAAPAYSGVEIDEESFVPPPGIKRISFVARTDEDGELDETVLDVVLTYRVAGCAVGLDIPHDLPVGDAKRLLSLAANGQFSLRLSAPPEEDTAAMGAYRGRVLSFTDAYLAQANFSSYLHPVTTVLHALFCETMKKGVTAEVKGVDPAVVAAVRERIVAGFGGPERFATVVDHMVNRLIGFGEVRLKEREDQRREQARRTAAMPVVAA